MLGLIGLALAGAATATGWALVQQRDGRFVISPSERYSVSSYLLTTTGRVTSYIAVLRDDYRPFQLDQGPSEPDDVMPAEVTRPREPVDS